jgi:DNA-binding MarR family transcriptional regulator
MIIYMYSRAYLTHHMEHVHIVGVGAHSDKSFRRTLGKGMKIDRVYIIMNSDAPDSIKQAAEDIRAIAKEFGIEPREKLIKRISLDEIRDAVLDIYRETPGAQYYFNVTGGTKVLSNGLFMMSIWMNGQAYYLNESESLEILRVPRIHAEDLEKNVNYITILQLLDATQTKEMSTGAIMDKLALSYKPIRMQEIERAKTEMITLSKGTLSKWLRDLESWGLVTRDHGETEAVVKGKRVKVPNRREKKVRITPDGVFTLRFILAARANHDLES